MLLIFLAKSSSLALVPLFTLSTLVWFLIKKERGTKIKFISRFIFLVIISFLLFFCIGYMFSIEKIISRFYQVSNVQFNNSIFSYPKDVSSFMVNNSMAFNLFFLFKFGKWNILLSFILYACILLIMIKKGYTFLIHLFFTSEIFLILFFNVFGNIFQSRYIFIFYTIYFLIFLNLFYIFSSKKIVTTVIYLFIFISLLVNSYYFFIYANHKVFFNYDKVSYIFDNLAEDESAKLKIYIEDEGQRLNYYFRSVQEIYASNFSHLEAQDSRFRYILVDDPKNADYILCHNCSSFRNLTTVEYLFDYDLKKT